jgi:uncharacterized protein involved in oxidation of intracellular sulfur
MKVLLVVNDPPYGTERAYNALRLAGALARKEGVQVRIFLVADGSACAQAGQKVPQGYYNIQSMLGAVARQGGEVGVCGTCMDARGIGAANLVEGAHRSSLEEWAAWTLEADKVIAF